MFKAIIALAIAYSSMASAVPSTTVYRCEIKRPCSQVNVLSYCMDNFSVTPVKGFEGAVVGQLVGFYENQVVKKLRSESTYDYFKSEVKNGQTKVSTLWEDDATYLEIYSNNGKKFGGTLHIEEDARFKVRCEKIVIRPLHR